MLKIEHLLLGANSDDTNSEVAVINSTDSTESWIRVPWRLLVF